MIELKNITSRMFALDKPVKELIEQTGASSVEDVIMLKTMYPEYNWVEVNKRLTYIEKEMAKANRKGHVPTVFYTKGYSNQALLQQDDLNKGNILLTNNPIEYDVRYFSLKNKSIRQIKNDLSHTYPDGKNYLLSTPCNYRNIGVKSIGRVISLIEMYEEQIERQASLTTKRNINLFEMDKKEKTYIVENMYKDIIEYLTYNTEEKLVWSTFSKRRKELYLLSIIKHTEQSERIKQIIIEYISNYTTLPELCEVRNNDLKVLKRFIIK